MWNRLVSSTLRLAKISKNAHIGHRQLHLTGPQAFASFESESEIREQYERDGFVIVRNAIDRDLAREIQGHVDWMLQRFPELPPEQLHHPLIEYDAFWLRIVSDPALLRLAAEFVGESIALFASHYFCKMPRSGQEVLWHQDGAYWPLKPMKVVSLWLAVDHSSRENGCLRVVRGSHRQALKELSRAGGDNVLSSYTDVDIREEDVVDIELQPGDVEIHHPNIIHGSEANTSDKRRCGLTIRYIPTSTSVVASPDDPIVPMNWLLRGNAIPGVNIYRSWPAYNATYSFPFQGSHEWNDRSEVAAKAVEESKSLTEEVVKQTSLSKAQIVVNGLKNT
ncbi:uncharacterized protein LOC135814272 [Sycon ciliatum]|uniref:uncharacterized protein LOC135814272 n=1 Tax=Sycon ciliatum TaxID=27933 RepID=UPI0020AD01C6|eukprot:scpid63411/ scgid19840/ Phytanoyl-CoA dioxygenase, peroxisomal; Phytanic acid oxidase; Phytanoyl-CoA alpha-hydroxylase